MQDHSEITKLKKAYMGKNKELEECLKEYPQFGEAMASKERDYLKAKAEVYTKLRIDGIQATLIPTIAKGRVSTERFEFKVAESNFHACRENIKRIHANLDAYRSLLSTAKSEISIR